MQCVAVLILVISAFTIYLGAFAHMPGDVRRRPYFLATIQVEAYARAVELYRADCGEYPGAREGLNDLIIDRHVQGWRGPYLKEPIRNDPWRMPYVYIVSPGATPEILSYGADRKPGGEGFNADISSRTPPQEIPTTPYEIQTRRIWIAFWAGAWLCLIGSIVILWKAKRTGPSETATGTRTRS
jgi:general secretion pathway protein G